MLLMAAQCGKSLVLQCVMGDRLRRGGSALAVVPDAAASGIALARRRIEKAIDGCAPLRALVQTGRAVKLGTSAGVMLRTFTHGASYQVTGAQSPSQLASTDVDTVIGDELARWPKTAGAEGSPVDLVVERAEAFRATRRIVFASTPVSDDRPCVAVASSWRRLNRWHAPCPSCGVWWSPAVGGRADGSLCAVRVPIVLGVGPVDGPARVEYLQAGEWRPSQPAPDPDVQSFRLPRWLSPASRLRDCVTARDRAERTNTRATWHRLTAAEPSEPDSTIDLTDIRAKLVDPAGAWPPAEVVDVVGGCDQQRTDSRSRTSGGPAAACWPCSATKSTTARRRFPARRAGPSSGARQVRPAPAVSWSMRELPAGPGARSLSPRLPVPRFNR